MMPKIINHPPALFWLLKLFFPAINPDYIIFAFGDRIYSVQPLPEHLLVHEKTHLRQHHHSRIIATLWWIPYILFPKFRLSQEIEAYANQWEFVAMTEPSFTPKGRANRIHILNWICRDLSSSMYNNLISYEAAKTKILQKTNTPDPEI